MRTNDGCQQVTKAAIRCFHSKKEISQSDLENFRAYKRNNERSIRSAICGL